jgi:hypothetical protein
MVGAAGFEPATKLTKLLNLIEFSSIQAAVLDGYWTE